MKHVDCGRFYFDDNVATFNTAKIAAEQKCSFVKSQFEEDERFVRVKVIQNIDHFLVDLKLTD